MALTLNTILPTPQPFQVSTSAQLRAGLEGVRKREEELALAEKVSISSKPRKHLPLSHLLAVARSTRFTYSLIRLCAPR